MHKKSLPQLGRRSRGATQITQAGLALISYLLKDGFTTADREFPPTIPSLGVFHSYYFFSSQYFISTNIQHFEKKCKYLYLNLIMGTFLTHNLGIKLF